MLYCWRWATTHSMASTTLETWAMPSRSLTLTPTRLTSGAIPTYRPLSAAPEAAPAAAADDARDEGAVAVVVAARAVVAEAVDQLQQARGAHTAWLCRGRESRDGWR